MNNEVKNVLFIVNKFAGGRHHRDLDTRIARVCHRTGVAGAVAFTAHPGHATSLAMEARQSGHFQWIIAVGGDGTVNEVAQGLLHSDIPMGILPIGSGNGLARHLRIPVDPDAALARLFESSIVDIDAFHINGKLSLNVSGIGFDGHIAHLFGKNDKRGLAGYAGNVLREYSAFREFSAEIVTPWETRRLSAFVIAVANSSQYGNNARIAPLASVRDQRLHITIVRKIPLYRIDQAYQLFAGNAHRSPFCETMTTDRLSIHLDKPMASHVDGEPVTAHTSFDIALSPLCLRMVTPVAPEKLSYL